MKAYHWSSCRICGELQGQVLLRARQARKGHDEAEGLEIASQENG